MLAPLLALALGLVDPASAQNAPEALAATLEQRIPALMRDYAVPGVGIALLQDGETVWNTAYSLADVETGRALTPEAIYRVESISKSVTAWGVMKLVQQGRIDLDMPVLHYIDGWRFPDSPLAAERITVRHLLSNTAGLAVGPIGEDAEYAPGGSIPSLEDYLSSAARLVGEPGAGFEYSNTGFNLLELLVEEVTGEPFAGYMAREVLAPLGMRTASFAFRPDMAPLIPTGYDLEGRPVAAYIYPASASGGLFATLQDVSRFVSAELGSGEAHAVLSDESIAALHAPQISITGLFSIVSGSYGLGHFVEELADGRRAVWHGGQGHGWMTHFHAVPESGDGIVILVNSQRAWPMISEILAEWSDWAGLPPVGMSRIAAAVPYLWAVIVAIGLAALGQASRLGYGLVSGGRAPARLAGASGWRRAGMAALAAGLGVALIWAAMQEYLFISSVFPTQAVWLWLALLGLAAVLALSALLPPRRTARQRE